MRRGTGRSGTGGGGDVITPKTFPWRCRTCSRGGNHLSIADLLFQNQHFYVRSLLKRLRSLSFNNVDFFLPQRLHRHCQIMASSAIRSLFVADPSQSVRSIPSATHIYRRRRVTSSGAARLPWQYKRTIVWVKWGRQGREGGRRLLAVDRRR